jgi:hypothetical protein
MPIVDDPFVKERAHTPPALYQTFLRVDPERLYVRVYIVLWDPRQVQLHMVAGTREPESATGETGSGMIPRQEETFDSLIGAFNGGFQALHGEFGMMAGGRVYLPPKPWAATVALYDDGRVALGSWKPPPEGVRDYEESWATDQIPDGMIAYRQNLTSVVEDGRINPWHRWYWGAAPLHAENQTFIDRSGLCLTEEGYLAYFWGRSMGPEQLGQAMLAARCVRGMHLDMNLPHTGFELYDVRPADAPHPPLDRKLTEDEYEGAVPYTKGKYVARARKAVRSMAPMRFPRYLRRDPRDFFYLTLKPTLPGPDLDVQGAAPDAGQFSTDGLPHAGWPHAFARAFLGGAEGERTWLVRIDPRRVRFQATVAPGEPLGEPLAYLTNAAGDSPAPDHALYALPQTMGYSYAVGRPPDGAHVLFRGPPLSAVPDARAAIAVDPAGFLVYAEQQPDDPQTVSQRLAEAGVERAVALAETTRLALVVDDQLMGPDAYEREVDPAHALPLFAPERPPRGEVLFPFVEPRPYGVWARLQDSRVRYFKNDDPPRFVRPDEDDEDAGADAVPDE